MYIKAKIRPATLFKWEAWRILLMQRYNFFWIMQEQMYKKSWIWSCFCRKERKFTLFLKISTIFWWQSQILCITLKPSSQAVPLNRNRVWGADYGWAHTYKAFTALGFWQLGISQIHTCSSKTKQRNAPLGVLYTVRIVSFCQHLCWLLDMRRYLHIRTAWGWTLLVSTNRAMREPPVVERVTGLGSTFFMHVYQ